MPMAVAPTFREDRLMLVVAVTIGPSKIHGIGLFAAERIAAGRIWWRYEPSLDQIRTAKEVEDMPPDARDFWVKYAFVRADDSRILCFDHARFVNHSATPNTREDDNGNSVAAVDIEVGEEITEDYTTF